MNLTSPISLLFLPTLATIRHMNAMNPVHTDMESGKLIRKVSKVAEYFQFQWSLNSEQIVEPVLCSYC